MALGVAVLVTGLVVWSQTRVIRVRPGPVRFEVVSLFGTRMRAFAIIDGDYVDSAAEVGEGEHELTLMLVDDPTARIELSRVVRAQGPRTQAVQAVTVRVAPWSGLRPRLLAKWEAHQARKDLREVTVRVRRADGSAVASSFVSCNGELKEADASGTADCGERGGEVKVMAWKDWYSPMAIGVVPASESELDLVVDDAPRDAATVEK